MKKTKKILACLLILGILVSTLKFLVFKPKNVLGADVYLGLNEGYGTTINDNNSNASGTITNAVWKQEEFCKVGKCLYFDGTGDLVTFGDDADLDFAAATNFTVEGWFRTPDITSGQRTLVAKYDPGTGTDGGYKVYIDSSGYVVFGIDDDQTSFPEDSASTTTSSFDDNKWHHFAAVKTGTTSITLYVDGIQYQTDSSISATGTLVNTDTFYIGMDEAGATNGFSGFIDEVKVYGTTARTAAEIKADILGETISRGVSASFSPDQSYLTNGLVGYWKLDESSGNVTDYSGNGFTLTNNGTTTFVAGKFGNGSEHVPASSQYLSTATAINGVKTVSFWTNPDSNTNYYISLTSGAYITSSSGTLTATGFTNPTIYINGVVNSTLVADTWQFVTVTTNTAIDANQFYVGRQDVNYYDGTLDGIRVYNRALNANEIDRLYNFAPGPVGYWKLDENTGTTANDSSSNANTGTITAGTGGWTTGKLGSTYNFDAANTLVDAGSGTSFANLAAVTISGWIYPKSEGETNDGKIICYSSGGSACPGSTDVGWGLGVGTTVNGLTFTAGYDSTDLLRQSGSNFWTANQWQYVTITWDGSTTASNIKMYINGIEEDSYGTTTDASTTRADDNTATILIGAASNVGVRVWDGFIDDLKVYNYVRTPTQIIEDMNAGHPAPGSPIGSATGYWKLDEGYGTTANDNSLNANNLTLSAAGWTNSAKFGKAYDGATDRRLTRSDDSDFDFINGTDNFTLSTWFNRGGAISNQEYLLDKHDTNDGYTLYMDSDGDIVCGIGDGTSFPEDTAGTTSANYDDTSWHHAVCVKSGTSSLRLYIDGKEVASDTAIAADADMSNAGKLILGDTNETDGTDEWLGDIDEVKIYRSALTADQVKVEYNRGASQTLGALSTDSTGTATWSTENSYCPPGQGSTCVAPVAEWKLDENTGFTINDTSSNTSNDTGTFYEGASSGASGPVWTQGYLGPGVSFSGTNDVIRIPESSKTDFGSSDTYSVSAWFKTSTTPVTNMSIITKEKDDSGAYPFRIFVGSSPNNVSFQISDSGGTSPASGSTTNVNDGKWHHVVGIRNVATDRLYLYLDGVLHDFDTDTTTLTLANNDDLSIGNGRAGGVADYLSEDFNGIIDNVRIYNYARTTAQVAWEYNQGGPALGWWKLDESVWSPIDCSTDTVFDSAINGYHLESCPTTTGPAGAATGKHNLAGDFDGSNDYLSIPDATVSIVDVAIREEKDFSIAGWFYREEFTTEDPIVSKRANLLNGNNGFVVWVGATDTLKFEACDVSGAACDRYLMESAKLFDDTNNTGWNHFVITWDDDSESNTNMYINGKLENFTRTCNALGGGSCAFSDIGTLENARNFTIGAQHAGTNPFNGKIDEIMLFGYTLNATQVKELYNAGVTNFGY